MKKYKQGFTLIELMIAVIIVTILASIAVTSYKQYILRKDLAVAKQEALRISTELERFKSKNFSYKGFEASYIYPSYSKTTGELLLPVGSSLTDAKYKLIVVDGDSKTALTSNNVNGLNWAIAVLRQKQGSLFIQPENYDVLMTSRGVKCISRDQSAVSAYEDCGTTDREDW